MTKLEHELLMLLWGGKAVLDGRIDDPNHNAANELHHALVGAPVFNVACKPPCMHSRRPLLSAWEPLEPTAIG